MEMVIEQSVPTTQAESNTLVKYLKHLPRTFRLQVHPDSGVLHEWEILEPETARRKANVWLLDNAGNLLGARNATLLVSGTIRWQFDVILTSPGRGLIGVIGKFCLDAVTGEAIVSKDLIPGFRRNADKLTAG